MRADRIIIIGKGSLPVRGIIYYINTLIPDAQIEICTSPSGITSGVAGDRMIIFVETDILEDPVQFSIQKLYQRCNKACFVSLSREKLPDALKPYFEGEILCTDQEDAIINVIRKVCSCRTRDMEGDAQTGLLSEREKEVLRGVALGLTNREISDELHISAHTVITHRKNISGKLGIKTIAGLAVYAVLNGIIASEEIERKY